MYANEPLTLFIELNNSEFVFAVGKNIEENEFNLIFVNSINNNIITLKIILMKFIELLGKHYFNRREIRFYF